MRRPWLSAEGGRLGTRELIARCSRWPAANPPRPTVGDIPSPMQRSLLGTCGQAAGRPQTRRGPAGRREGSASPDPSPRKPGRPRRLRPPSALGSVTFRGDKAQAWTRLRGRTVGRRRTLTCVARETRVSPDRRRRVNKMSRRTGSYPSDRVVYYQKPPPPRNKEGRC